jgi:hypothetical protein
MQILGHKNVASINNYSILRGERHKKISNILSNTESETKRNALVPVVSNLPRTTSTNSTASSNSDVSCRSNPDVPSYCANTNMSSQISSVLWGGPPCQHTESEGLVTIFCIPRPLLPQSWLNGIIKPIYKNKGDVKDPMNHRPITIVSCLGKLFTAILNARLNDYTEEFMMLKENQSCFRQSYSTLDNIFAIFTLFQILKSKRKKLYCAFIDLEKSL